MLVFLEIENLLYTLLVYSHDYHNPKETNVIWRRLTIVKIVILSLYDMIFPSDNIDWICDFIHTRRVVNVPVSIPIISVKWMLLYWIIVYCPMCTVTHTNGCLRFAFRFTGMAIYKRARCCYLWYRWWQTVFMTLFTLTVSITYWWRLFTMCMPLAK